MKINTKVAIIFSIIFILLFFTTSKAVHAETVNTPYLNWFQDRCAIYNVPLEVALAVAIVESNVSMITSDYNSNGSYDIGIFQLNSHFVEWFEKALWYDDRNFNPNDPENNIEMGIIYLKHLYKQTRSWDKAVKAFNIGLHALAYDPDRANAYFIKVVNVLNTLELK